MANEPLSSIYEERLELMGSPNHPHFSQRTARFINNPAAKPLHESAPFFKPTKQSNPLFKSWKPPPPKWAEWVDQMAGKHSAVWIKSGIFDPIMSSIYEIPCNNDLISELSRFWTPKSNTFVLFPWKEEVTITLEDVTILGGFSVLGDPVDDDDDGIVVSIPDLAGKVEEMKEFRSELVRGRSKKASHSKWIEKFMKSEHEQEHEHEIEHVAFLSLWLSRFAFPSGDQDSVGKHVFPIATRLSRGVKLALGPAILAYIYRSLTRLKEQSVGSDSNRCVNLFGPFQLVQIWGYERFPDIGPKTPNELRPGEPRLARWHGLKPEVSVPRLEGFIWRPYAVDLQNWKQPLYYQDSDQILSDSVTLDDDLKSFVRFITPCELDGLGFKAKYHPHRVAMQFGFDQDIPGDVCSTKSSEFVNFFVPSRSFRPGVSKRYSDWWKNVDQMGVQKDQDSSVGERINASMEFRKFDQKDCGKNCDFDFVDLTIEDGFDDVLVRLKKICDDTKRKIDSLKESKIGAQRSKKLRSELGSDTIDVIIID